MSKFTQGRQLLAERPYILAILITVILVLWMASGVTQQPEAPAKKVKGNALVPKVKVETRYADTISDSVELYGRTEPDRITTLKAEINGKITKVLAKRGSVVKKGEVIAKIAINDFEAQLKRSKALLDQREIEYAGAKTLNADGYQGKVQVASAKANLEEVKSEIKRLELNIEHTIIVAPFDGVLNTRYVEEGDYVQSGDNIAMIADLDPLIVRAFVTENQVSQLSGNQAANIRLLNHNSIDGIVRYIASVADDATNTFKIEIAIENTKYQYLAGLSGEVNIPLQLVPAIKISPALLALDELGNIGVKTVENNIVKFTAIDIVKSESDGIWLTGLGQQADIITLGQGFVRAGDEVNPVMSLTAK
ncbi:MAG: multidrug efflux system membrane fusion protein [Alteromonadaceae bacterium]|jgi:multidrug efflux system membrane fusion protein